MLSEVIFNNFLSEGSAVVMTKTTLKQVQLVQQCVERMYDIAEKMGRFVFRVISYLIFFIGIT